MEARSLDCKGWLVWGRQPGCLPEDLGLLEGLLPALRVDLDILSQGHVAFPG